MTKAQDAVADRPAEFLAPRGVGASPAAAVLALSGDWTARTMARAPVRLAEALRRQPPATVDITALGRVDTSGAYVLGRIGEPWRRAVEAGRPELLGLVALVEGDTAAAPPAPARSVGWAAPILSRLGSGGEDVASESLGAFGFLGRLITALGALILRPDRLRAAPTVALMERAGLDAIPIVMATTFFVGATIAFLGATLLAQFGAQVFSVELVGIGVLREFGVLVTCIILAGRSASSFAAEIGAMKMNQEVDAMQTMGVDPFQALVIPRFLAMLAMTPILTFAAMIAGLAGGLLVIWTVLDLSPAFFFERLVDNVGPKQFWLGMVKAPALAMVIAAIGCRQGLEVGGDVEQLGRRVTTAVVQARFAIILLDALFALLFMEIGV